MQAHDLKNEILRILDQQIQCVLATVNDNHPYQHMMAFAFSEDLSRIYLATYMDTRKFRNMISNHSVSLLWDNRSGSAEDHVDGLSLIASGNAELVDTDSTSDVGEILLKRNPALKVLLEDESCRLFEIMINDYQWTKGYQEVFRYTIA
jgi:nitroimidazol reductase NimA-like FMN-containing flavoprotein (pyridoxamine 5'-phosphate oxidase superfamily)